MIIYYKLKNENIAFFQFEILKKIQYLLKLQFFEPGKFFLSICLHFTVSRPLFCADHDADIERLGAFVDDTPVCACELVSFLMQSRSEDSDRTVDWRFKGHLPAVSV